MEVYFQSDLMQEALRKIDQIELESLDEEASLGHIFSQNYKKKKKQLLRSAREYELIHFPYMLRRVAMIAIIIVGGMFAVTVTIPAARTQLLKVIEKIFPTHMDLELDKDKSKHILKKKKYQYKPTYIPKGYLLVDKDSVEDGIYTYSHNDDNKYIMVSYIQYEGSGAVSLSPEHSTIEKGMFGKWKSYFMADNDGITNGLTWFTDEYMFQVIGTVSKEEIYKISKNIEKF